MRKLILAGLAVLLLVPASVSAQRHLEAPTPESDLGNQKPWRDLNVSRNITASGDITLGGGIEHSGTLALEATAITLSLGGTTQWAVSASAFYPGTTDLETIGFGPTRFVRGLYLSRSIEGSKTKALTEASATTFATVAVPQTAGANYAGGEVLWTVYADDATDSQVLTGRAVFAAVNKVGVESCSIDDNQITAEVASSGTLTCTIACAVGLTDVVGLTADCTSSLTQTTLDIQARFNMTQPNTLTFP